MPTQADPGATSVVVELQTENAAVAALFLVFFGMVRKPGGRSTDEKDLDGPRRVVPSTP